ncbi:3-hydroxyacyl-ACP dehydratase FabZ family protein [Streptomyces sp. NPDC052042]|uniref:3-hydroxyacyl-ACP dehydratase FabZ family protein n=1 Tax=Streptomyces sp. NPDC052042 TaxID=3365683 RepID=UPI0037CDB69D
MRTLCTPVDGTPEVTDVRDGGATTRVTVSSDERVFPGHYPGFPIFPGVCVVEYVHLGALATLPATEGEWELSAVETTRFLSPVFPGDVLTTELAWSRDGEAWRCKAVASSPRGSAAQVRLRFEQRSPR